MNSCLPQVQRQTRRKQDTSARKLQTRCCRVDYLVAAVIGNQFLLKYMLRGIISTHVYGFLGSQVWKEIKQDSYMYIPDIKWQPSMVDARSHNAVYMFNSFIQQKFHREVWFLISCYNEEHFLPLKQTQKEKAAVHISTPLFFHTMIYSNILCPTKIILPACHFLT